MGSFLFSVNYCYKYNRYWRALGCLLLYLTLFYDIYQSFIYLERSVHLFIDTSALGGRGVFTYGRLLSGTLIEVSPVIVLSSQDRERIHQTSLHDYYFLWGEQDEEAALVLGYGSIYNHSYEPNAEYEADYGSEVLRFYALREIAAGEEITVNYNGTPSVKDALWFEDRGQTAPERKKAGTTIDQEAMKKPQR